MQPLRIGLVGAGGRARAFDRVISSRDDVTIAAVCDVDLYDDGVLDEAANALDADEAYRDYCAMLVDADLDAVVIGTPMHLHATQAIAALERDLHVLSEVPAGVGIGECRDLVAAAERSAGSYMLAENYIYMRQNRHVEQLVEAGLFGDIYYAEAEYLHELKALSDATPWRRVWSRDRPGVTYPTHCLGPVLRWFGDDRIDQVACVGAGTDYSDGHGDSAARWASTVLLGRTERDRLVKVRYDATSERPHAMDNYQLQGTTGAYESARAPGEHNKIWLDAFEEAESSHDYAWLDLAELDQHLPSEWTDPPAAVADAGHGGGDFFVCSAFLDAVQAGESPPIDVHAAMDMTLPGLASIESARNDGAWTGVPNSRCW